MSLSINYESINQHIVPFMWIMVGVALVLFVISIMLAIYIDKKIAKSSETAFKKGIYFSLDIFYTAFIVLISLFPLMGMLGTVSSLITLDISGATEDLKTNFFQALDTTGIGLVCAIFFKFINAFFQPLIEGSITKAKKMLEKGEINE